MTLELIRSLYFRNRREPPIQTTMLSAALALTLVVLERFGSGIVYLLDSTTAPLDVDD